MREIKFRAWDREFKKMYYSPYDSDFNVAITLPNLIDYYPKSEYAKANFLTYRKDGGCSDFQSLKSRRFDLMLTIGLKDKNGKQIYDKDILEGQTGYSIERLLVFYNPPKYQLKTSEGYFVDFESGKVENFEKYYRLAELEVIGNLYEIKDELFEE